MPIGSNINTPVKTLQGNVLGSPLNPTTSTLKTIEKQQQMGIKQPCLSMENS